VGELYGYRVVYMMKHLDMFLIRKDLLYATCTEMSLPPFSKVANRYGRLPRRYGPTCRNSDVTWLVDFPLAAMGMTRQAKAKAMEEAQRLNQLHQSRGLRPFCDMPTSWRAAKQALFE